MANGSTGIIKQIVWNSTATDETIYDADNMFVWIDFEDDYKGESFFPDDDKKKVGFQFFLNQLIILREAKQIVKDMSLMKGRCFH